MTCQSHHLCEHAQNLKRRAWTRQGRLAISTVTLLSLTGVLGFMFKLMQRKPNCAELAFQRDDDTGPQINNKEKHKVPLKAQED